MKKSLLFFAISIFCIATTFVSCTKDDSASPIDAATGGLVGKWYSNSTNVATLLSTYFKTDSISAEFKADQTYIVKEFRNKNRTATPDMTYSGTYTVTKPTSGTIWKIEVSQSIPSVGTSIGIYEVTEGSPITMKYEVVLTTGTQNTPPTAVTGFGGTNGGTLGTANIQKYKKF